MTVQHVNAAAAIFTELANGVHDDQLEQIAEAIRDRRKYVSRQQGLANQASFTAGTPVVISGGIRPKYLVGVTGVVSARPARRAGDIQVDIDEEYQDLTRRFGPSVGVPAASLARL